MITFIANIKRDRKGRRNSTVGRLRALHPCMLLTEVPSLTPIDHSSPFGVNPEQRTPQGMIPKQA